MGRGFYRSLLKPTVDRLVALIVLLVSSPVLLLAMTVLAITNKGSIWFTQLRPGLGGQPFKVLKFKTMRDAYTQQGELLPDGERLTWAGRVIRKTSLDELPQLVNVLKGDMSLVGPRPLLMDYLPLYNEHQKRRHEVLPGITGWAQVNGRNTLAWKQRFEHDVWYVDHQSFWLDLKILWLTVIKVFKAEGISSGKSETMEKFSGNS